MSAIIPDEVKLQFSFLAKYKLEVSDRVIKYVPPILSTTMKKVKNEEVLADPKIKRENPPLCSSSFLARRKPLKINYGSRSSSRTAKWPSKSPTRSRPSTGRRPKICRSRSCRKITSRMPRPVA
uniref:(northern house mosquito) hypothetical protein n=2 Tax=Culex pipiens TaxID=7175 RepID=A0A8D8CCG5_CULPI